MTDEHTEPRPLRETVARAIHECSPEGNKDGDDWQFGYIDRYVTAVYEQADAAIAAMVTALLSEAAVEAAESVMGRPHTDDDGWNIPSGRRYRMTDFTIGLEAALRRIGAYGEGGER